jgi:hypothetical protein
MNSLKIVAIALLIGGVFAIAYGGFSYTKDTTAVKIGSMELKVKETETVNIPLWAGIAAIGAGVFLLVSGNKK